MLQGVEKLKYEQLSEQQLFNEIECHIQLWKSKADFMNELINLIKEFFNVELKKNEKLFLKNIQWDFKNYFTTIGIKDAEEDFNCSLWSIWIAELFVNIVIVDTQQTAKISYTTHELLNHIYTRYIQFRVYFDEDFKISRKDETLVYKLILKIIQHLIKHEIISRRLTYEYDNKIKSIYIYDFEAKLNLKFNLYHLNINLITPVIFTNQEKLHTKVLTYLSIKKIMLAGEGNLKEFFLKDLTVLYKLYATRYLFDTAFYNEMYNYVLEITPNTMVQGEMGWKWTLREKNLGSYWYNLIYLNLKEHLGWLEKGIYWSYIFDFRGRLYIDSVVSYQSSKIFRHLYLYEFRGEYANTQTLVKDINMYIGLIINKTSLTKDYPELNVLQNEKIIFWLFIEIAKIFKNEELTYTKFYLDTEELISLAIKKYMLGSTDLDFEKKIEFVFIKSILKRLNTGIKLNYIIFKDATASALQLLTLVLNVKDKELVKIFNLRSETTWYDPYTYIIGLFLAENEVGAELQGFFSRKYLKKTIMTYNYSATLYTCMQNFYEETNIKALAVEEKKKITNQFIKFYKFLENLFNDKNFFEASLSELNNSLISVLIKENRLKITLNDESTAELQYYNKKSKQLNMTTDEKRRVTTILWVLTHFIDLKKTSNALKPNLIHALDAALVRLTIYNANYTLATIHDSFGAPIYNIEDIIVLVNDNINKVFYKAAEIDWHSNKHYYSIYIIF